MIEVKGQKFNWLALRVGKYGGIDVVGHGTYPESSVLAGQTSTVFLDNLPTEEEARAAFPQAQQFENKWTAPQVSLAHLPDENDPVPGGMYPDDMDGFTLVELLIVVAILSILLAVAWPIAERIIRTVFL